MISVIIPVYNIPSNYLEDCLRSILNQSYKNFEVIIINDGSVFPENDLIINVFLKTDTRIVYIPLENNGGVSRARNIGLERAKGEWIFFADADDIVANDIFNEFISIITVQNVKMVMPLTRFDKNSDGSSYHIRKLEPGLHISEQSSSYLKDCILNCGLSIVGKFIHKSIINEIRFPVDIPMYEDYISLWKIAVKRPSYAIIDKIGYVARYRVDSISHSCNGIDYYRKRIKSLIFACKNIKELFNDNIVLRRILSKFVIIEGLACNGIFANLRESDKAEVIFLTDSLWNTMQDCCVIPWYLKILLVLRLGYLKKNISKYPMWLYLPIRAALRLMYT